MSAWSGQPQLSGETFGPAVDAAHEDERRIVGQVGRQQLVGRAQPWQVLARVDGADIEDVALGRPYCLRTVAISAAGRGVKMASAQRGT